MKVLYTADHEWIALDDSGVAALWIESARPGCQRRAKSTHRGSESELCVGKAGSWLAR